jgi:aryl-alcohol dehydrogenase-like predicted oxidoreductase
MRDRGNRDEPRVIPLIGPRTPEQLENLLPALDLKLSAEQMQRLADTGA